MKIELTHDIIAEKVWEKLPEQDKQLRLIRNSLQQRWLDYQKESGSLLGEKELIAWENYFSLMDLSEDHLAFISKSKETIERQKKEEQEQQERELRLTRQKLAVERHARKRQRIFLFGLGLLTITAIVLSIWAINSRRIAEDKEQEAQQKRLEAEAANIKARLRIEDLAITEYQNNLDQARQHRRGLDLEASFLAAREALAVFSKFDSALLGTNIDHTQVAEIKLSWDSNGIQVRNLIDTLERELPGFPEYQKLIEKARQYEMVNDYINALNTFLQARDKLASNQVEHDIERVINDGFNYFSRRGRGHLESGTKQDYQLAVDYFTEALALRKDPDVNTLLQRAKRLLSQSED